MLVRQRLALAFQETVFPTEVSHQGYRFVTTQTEYQTRSKEEFEIMGMEW